MLGPMTLAADSDLWEGTHSAYHITGATGSEADARNHGQCILISPKSKCPPQFTAKTNKFWKYIVLIFHIKATPIFFLIKLQLELMDIYDCETLQNVILQSCLFSWNFTTHVECIPM